jgi:hypothetical protein
MTSTPLVNVDQATQTTLLAIQALFHDPDAQAKKRANEWLSEFQHTVSVVALVGEVALTRLQSEAWQTCHTLLTAPEAPQEARMVAAQTLRSKVSTLLLLLNETHLPRSYMISHNCPGNLCSPSETRSSNRYPTLPIHQRLLDPEQSPLKYVLRSRISLTSCQSGRRL